MAREQLKLSLISFMLPTTILDVFIFLIQEAKTDRQEAPPNAHNIQGNIWGAGKLGT